MLCDAFKCLGTGDVVRAAPPEGVLGQFVSGTHQLNSAWINQSAQLVQQKSLGTPVSTGVHTVWADAVQNELSGASVYCCVPHPLRLSYHPCGGVPHATGQHHAADAHGRALSRRAARQRAPDCCRHGRCGISISIAPRQRQHCAWLPWHTCHSMVPCTTSGAAARERHALIATRQRRQRQLRGGRQSRKPFETGTSTSPCRSCRTRWRCQAALTLTSIKPSGRCQHQPCSSQQ